MGEFIRLYEFDLIFKGEGGVMVMIKILVYIELLGNNGIFLWLYKDLNMGRSCESVIGLVELLDEESNYGW